MSQPEFGPVMADDPERSVQSVISNEDLLKEILVRLPVLSLVLFKSVSKHWLSLIKGANVRKLDPLSGLFLKKYIYKYAFERRRSTLHDIICDFVPLDIRIPICRSSLLATFDPEVRHETFLDILDSCNGLLLCRKYYPTKYYVYNPSIANMFKVLSKSDNDQHFPTGVDLKLAFDPTKSPHYKVIYSQPFDVDWVRIHTYSSETGNWSLCGRRFPAVCFIGFRDGVYWNDVIYWIDDKGNCFKLDIMNEHPVLRALQTPLTLDRKKVHYECRLLESRGCLLLVDKDDAHSRHFTIYDKENVYSEWSVKYIVNLDDIITPLPKRWRIDRNIFRIVLDEREEDSFLVMELDKKVVQYKFVSKTLSTIYDLGPNEDLVTCFQFIPSFANV